MTSWPRGGARLPGVGEHGDDDPKGRGGEHDRHEQRPPHDAGGAQPKGDDERDRQRDREPEGRHAQRPAYQPGQVYLQSRQKEQEREPEQGQYLQRQVHLDEPETRRPDGNARHDLEHDRR